MEGRSIRSGEFEMREEKAKALFLLAGFEVEKTYEIANGYWPEAYHELRRDNPWWLMKTEHGLIKIGWRKRVISIDWSDTHYRAGVVGEGIWPNTITEDEVTRSETNIHAYTYFKALEYLTKLRQRLEMSPETDS